MSTRILHLYLCTCILQHFFNFKIAAKWGPSPNRKFNSEFCIHKKKSANYNSFLEVDLYSPHYFVKMQKYRNNDANDFNIYLNVMTSFDFCSFMDETLLM